MAKEELADFNVCILPALKKRVDKYVQCDFRKNSSEFAKDSLREKLSKDVGTIVLSGFFLFSGLFSVLRFFSDNRTVPVICKIGSV